MSKNVGVIICAAGASSRFGGTKKKPFIELDGRAIFLRSIELFAEREDVKQILLAISAEDEEIVNVRWGANLAFDNIQVYIGGKERFETVAKGLELLKDNIEIVAVHDAVRCCAKKEWVDEAIKKAGQTGAAILACPAVATLKRKSKDDTIIETVDRSDIYEAQTPQVFSTEIIKKAYANLGNVDEAKISDDAQLAEAIGARVSIVKTDGSNIKITQKSDVAIASAILKSRSKDEPRGYVGPYREVKW